MQFTPPKKRSFLRLFVGRLYFKTRRYQDWFLRNKCFAHHQGQITDFPFVCYHHESPLIRNLPKVQMILQYNKITNLKLALHSINEIIIHPGETFSYWKLIGKPTPKKGYMDGIVLFNGQIKAGVGGGLCQLSNLIYWMTLHTPLMIVERWRHSYDVFPDAGRTNPFGSGATCAYPSLDLQIFNPTKQPFLLNVYLTDTQLVGEWRTVKLQQYQYKIYEENHWITHEPWGGYLRHNILRRKSFNLNGDEVKDEFITENHAVMMYQPFIEDKEKWVVEK